LLFFITTGSIDPRGKKLKKLKPGWNGNTSMSSILLLLLLLLSPPAQSHRQENQAKLIILAAAAVKVDGKKVREYLCPDTHEHMHAQANG